MTDGELKWGPWTTVFDTTGAEHPLSVSTAGTALTIGVRNLYVSLSDDGPTTGLSQLSGTLALDVPVGVEPLAVRLSVAGWLARSRGGFARLSLVVGDAADTRVWSYDAVSAADRPTQAQVPERRQMPALDLVESDFAATLVAVERTARPLSPLPVSVSLVGRRSSSKDVLYLGITDVSLELLSTLRVPDAVA